MPEGDVIRFTVPNSQINRFMRLLDGFDLGLINGISLSSDDPASYIPVGRGREIERDNNEATWEEMIMTISNDSNASINTLVIMYLSGSLATIGIVMNSLHIVIAGMLIAPGFMPISRIALGVVAQKTMRFYGMIDFLKGYALLIAGAILTYSAFLISGKDPFEVSSGYYVVQNTLVAYWTSFGIPGIVASAVASIAGAILLATRKSVFTSGVMIGLALVPTAAISGFSLLAGNMDLAFFAFLRFLLDAAIVFLFSLIAFKWIRVYFHQRGSRM